MQRAEAFYRRLLELDAVIEPEPLVADVVALITEVADARLGCVELFGTPPLCVVRRLDDEGEVSREIIDAAVGAHTTINVASTFEHPRFQGTAHRSRAVMCAPIGSEPAAGVVYLQGRRTAGRFSDLDRERVELLAARLAPIADRIRHGRGASKVTLDDEVRWLEYRHARASLARNAGNLSTTARELGITRARLYRIMKRGA